MQGVKERPQASQPFDPEQSRGAQDRELVERPAEWQMTSRWWIRGIKKNTPYLEPGA